MSAPSSKPQEELDPVTCARCGRTEVPSWQFDYYTTPHTAPGERICETCFRAEVRADNPGIKFMAVDKDGNQLDWKEPE